MGEIVPFTGTLHRVVVNPPSPFRVVCDVDLATERARLDGKPCKHADGRVGIVAGVFREGPLVLAKLWRGMQFDPVLASKLTPIGGRVA